MLRLVVVLVASLVAAVSSALAEVSGTPGTWTRVTDPGSVNIDEVGASRTKDGILHVVWKKKVNSSEESIRHTPITPAGKVGSSSSAISLMSVGNPDLVTLPDGRLRMFFPGLGNTNEDGGIKAATAPASGKGWVRDGLRVSSSVSALAAPGAGVTKDGDTVFAYTKTGTLAFHVGLDMATPDTEVQPNVLCCDYNADVATDAASGESFLAWYSNAKGRTGVWARRILPGVAAPALAPGSVSNGNSLGVDQRTPITGRIGAPGVVVGYCSGYPTCKRVMLWRVGGKALPVASGDRVEDVNVAAAPEGRLWLVWSDNGGTEIFAARTNRAVTRLGPVAAVKPPAGSDAIWKLKGEGSLGPLDVLASVRTPTSPAGTWHTQVWPPLQLSARVRANPKTKKDEAVFSVTDVGDPVAGAKIAFAGRVLTTDASGRAVAAAPAAKAEATARRAGYQPATAAVGG